MKAFIQVEFLRTIAVSILLFFGLNAEILAATCPPCGPMTCPPCGQVNIDAPPCGYEPVLVQPVENYMASTSGPNVCAIANGFYIGTGFGYGQIDYDLTIPGLGITFDKNTSTYITENVGIGYVYTSPRGFFFGVELAYNYRSTVDPIYYTDPSILISYTFDIDPFTFITGTFVTPCDVRLDINSNNSGTLDFMPGFAITPRFVIYGRIGLEVTSFSWQRHICFPQVSDFDFVIDGISTNIVQVFDEEFSDEVTDTVLGFRLGVGISYAAGPHVSFNVNYIHTFPENGTFTPNQSVLTAMATGNPVLLNNFAVEGTVNIVDLNTLALNNNIQPTRDEITFGVRFTF